MVRAIEFSTRFTKQLQKILDFYDRRNGTDAYSKQLLKALMNDIVFFANTPTASFSSTRKDVWFFYLMGFTVIFRYTSTKVTMLSIRSSSRKPLTLYKRDWWRNVWIAVAPLSPSILDLTKERAQRQSVLWLCRVMRKRRWNLQRVAAGRGSNIMYYNTLCCLLNLLGVHVRWISVVLCHFLTPQGLKFGRIAVFRAIPLPL